MLGEGGREGMEGGNGGKRKRRYWWAWMSKGRGKEGMGGVWDHVHVWGGKCVVFFLFLFP